MRFQSANKLLPSVIIPSKETNSPSIMKIISNKQLILHFTKLNFSFMKKTKTYGSLVIKPFYLNTSFTYESFFGYILMNNEGKITK